jgi:hypothetical protein
MLMAPKALSANLAKLDSSFSPKYGAALSLCGGFFYFGVSD